MISLVVFFDTILYFNNKYTITTEHNEFGFNTNILADNTTTVRLIYKSAKYDNTGVYNSDWEMHMIKVTNVKISNRRLLRNDTLLEFSLTSI